MSMAAGRAIVLLDIITKQQFKRSILEKNLLFFIIIVFVCLNFAFEIAALKTPILFMSDLWLADRVAYFIDSKLVK